MPDLVGLPFVWNIFVLAKMMITYLILANIQWIISVCNYVMARFGSYRSVTKRDNSTHMKTDS